MQEGEHRESTPNSILAQMTDILVCCRHVVNVDPTGRRHSVMSAIFLAVCVMSGNCIPDTLSYMQVGIITGDFQVPTMSPMHAGITSFVAKNMLQGTHNYTTWVKIAMHPFAWICGECTFKDEGSKPEPCLMCQAPAIGHGNPIIAIKGVIY